MFYRVSRKIYKSGEKIEEGQPGEKTLANMEYYIDLIKSGDEQAIRSRMLELQKTNTAQWEKEGGTYKEAYLEFLREKEFPHLPCRYKHLMVFDDLKTACFFNEKYRKSECLIYMVNIGNSNYFRGDMSILDTVEVVAFEANENMCRRYWKSETTANPIMECILFSPQNLTVV